MSTNNDIEVTDERALSYFKNVQISKLTADMFNNMKKKKKKILRKFILALFPSIKDLKLLICDLFDKRETQLDGLANEEAAARYILSNVTSYKKFLKYLRIRDTVKDKSDEESDSDDSLSSGDSMLEGFEDDDDDEVEFLGTASNQSENNNDTNKRKSSGSSSSSSSRSSKKPKVEKKTVSFNVTVHNPVSYESSKTGESTLKSTKINKEDKPVGPFGPYENVDEIDLNEILLALDAALKAHTSESIKIGAQGKIFYYRDKKTGFLELDTDVLKAMLKKLFNKAKDNDGKVGLFLPLAFSQCKDNASDDIMSKEEIETAIEIQKLKKTKVTVKIVPPIVFKKKTNSSTLQRVVDRRYLVRITEVSLHDINAKYLSKEIDAVVERGEYELQDNNSLDMDSNDSSEDDSSEPVHQIYYIIVFTNDQTRSYVLNFDDGESDYERMTRLLQIAEKKNMTLIVTYFDPTPPKSKNQLTNDYNKMCRKELLEAFNNPNSQLYKSFNEKALGLISQFTSIKHKGRLQNILNGDFTELNNAIPWGTVGLKYCPGPKTGQYEHDENPPKYVPPSDSDKKKGASSSAYEQPVYNINIGSLDSSNNNNNNNNNMEDTIQKLLEKIDNLEERIDSPGVSDRSKATYGKLKDKYETELEKLVNDL